jgi:uncharacterized protein
VILLAVPFGLLIGLVVGTVGGGGAILALPVLVYVLDQPVGPASTASLIVVATAAAFGASARAREGRICWRLALGFSGAAAVGSLVGALAGAAVSGRALVVAFIPVMAVAAIATWHRAATVHDEAERPCPTADPARLATAGLFVGMLTGFFGVGGGFVIVPVLTIWMGMSFQRAVATSLVIIALTGLVALTIHLYAGARPDVGITVTLAAATAIGAVVGSSIGGRLPQAVLGKAFAVVVATVGALLLVDVVFLGGPPEA